MPTSVEDLAVFLQPIALIVTLVFLYGLASRYVLRGWMRQATLAAIFAVTALYAASDPMIVHGALHIDLHFLMVGAAAALIGPLSAIAAAGAVCGYLYAMQIEIVKEAVLLATVVAVGQVWHHLIWHRKMNEHAKYLSMGAATSAHLILWGPLFGPLPLEFFTGVAPYLVLMNVIGGYFICQLIVTEQRMLYESAALASFEAGDPLSHLMNRRSARNAVANLPRNEQPGMGRSVICFDVDQFGEITDKHGYGAGEVILLEVTNRVQQCLRPDDIFSRLKADKFMIVLPSVSADAAKAVAARCQASVADIAIPYEAMDVPITISLGISWSRRAIGHEAHVAAADTALRDAKTKGTSAIGIHLTPLRAATEMSEELV